MASTYQGERMQAMRVAHSGQGRRFIDHGTFLNNLKELAQAMAGTHNLGQKLSAMSPEEREACKGYFGRIRDALQSL